MAGNDTQAFFDWFNTLTPAEQSNFQATFGTGTGAVTPSAPSPATPVAVDPNVTPVASTPGTAVDVAAQNRELFAQIAARLDSIGLSSLYTLGTSGQPGGWLWEQITSGIANEAVLMSSLESTTAYQQRFPIIFEMREKSKGGDPGYVPSPQEVLQYEEKVQQTMRAAGIPAEFYNDRAYIQNMMGEGLSPLEVEARLGSAWALVRETSPVVLDKFTEFFGLSGDGALASLFLDPSRTQGMLDRMARTAYTAGMGQSLGINIDQTLADRMASLPKTEGGIFQDLTEVNRMMRSGGVFQENYGEVQDLTAETTGIDAVTFGEGDAAAAIQRRIIERQAIGRASFGGAALTNEGLTGVASS